MRQHDAPQGVRNVVNYRRMVEKLNEGHVEHEDDLRKVIAMLSTHPDDPNMPGLKVLSDNYYAQALYARWLAAGLAMQRESHEIRSIAYAGHAVDVDMDDAYGRLMYNLLLKLGLYTDEKYFLMQLSTVHHRSWRKALMEIRSVDYKEAKREICRLMFELSGLDDPPQKHCHE